MPSAGSRLRAKWAADEPAFGLWAGIPSSFTAELAATAGYDYVCVDLQHGVSDEAAMISIFQASRAAGAAPITRVAWNEPWLIMRALDLGAVAVIVPMVGSGEDAARAVQACRYPPEGRRSYGPVRAGMVVGSVSPEELARDAMCFAMVETRDGLERLDEIAGTPGLDGIYIGPSDLSLGLGLAPPGSGDQDAGAAARLEQAIDRVRETCLAHDLIAGMHCTGGRVAAAFAQRGFRLVTVGTDYALLRAAVRLELDEARAGWARVDHQPGAARGG